MTSVAFRTNLLPSDRAEIESMVRETGFFSSEETAVAVELVDEFWAKGVAAGYHFVMAEAEGKVVGYSCYGPIPATQGSFDLYWIVVSPAHQGQGLGQALLGETERQAVALGANRMWVDTSGRPQYAPTRRFYDRAGYAETAQLKDFYAEGDSKVIFVKVLK